MLVSWRHVQRIQPTTPSAGRGADPFSTNASSMPSGR